MKARKRFILITAIALSLTLTACDGTSPTGITATTAEAPAATSAQPPSESTSEAEAPAAVRIIFATQEYEGDNIAEIPYFAYGGDKNDEVDSINQFFAQNYQILYEDFLANADDGAWIEIKSYPFTDDRYVQTVITYRVYPNVRWSGTLESVNYDRLNNRWIKFSDLGIGEDAVFSEVRRLFEPEYEGAVIDGIKVAGFLLRAQGADDGTLTEILLEITTSSADSDPYAFFYSYCPETGELYKLDGTCLYGPPYTDRMDPPLYCQREDEPPTGGEPIVDGVIYTASLLERDPGENISGLDAATGLYHLVLQNVYSEGSDYNAQDPMYITCTGVQDVGGEECYLLQVSGSFGSGMYAVSYQGNVYEIAEGNNHGLGNINDLGRGDQF